MTVSERIPFSGLLLPLQKGYTYVFASFNSIMVGVLMVAIAVYVCVGLPNMNPGQLVLADMFSSGTKLTTLGAGIALLSSSLSGGTSISQIADDVKNPRRNIPLAILLAPVVVAVIYILMAVVTLGAMPEGQLTTLSEVAKGFLPPALVTFFIVGGPLCGVLTSMVPVIMMTCSQIQAAAETGLFPAVAAKKNKHGISPRGAGVRDALRNRYHLHRRDVWRTDDAVLVCQLSGRYRAVHHPVLPAQKVSPCLPPRGLHDAAVGAARHVRVRHRRGRVPVVFGAADAGRHGVAAAGRLRGGIRGVCTAAHRVPEKAGPRPHGRAEGPLYPLRRARGRVRRHGCGQVKKLPILTTPYTESTPADHPPGCSLACFYRTAVLTAVLHYVNRHICAAMKQYNAAASKNINACSPVYVSENIHATKSSRAGTKNKKIANCM